MNPRSKLHWLGLTLILASCTTVQRCQLPGCTLKAFVYQPHKLPRVFVHHRPLNPIAGARLEVIVEPELDTGRTVSRAFALLRLPEGTDALTQDCESINNNQYRCSFPLPDAAHTGVYSGGVVDDDGDYTYSYTGYRFQLGRPDGDVVLIPVRVPLLKFPAAPDDPPNHDNMRPSARIDTVFVRDPSLPANASEYSEVSFFQDLEQALYEQLLKDPVYRWRDDQLGFYAYTRPGFTRSYVEARDTRCGQNPWPGDSGFPDTLNAMELIGVVHRRGSPSDALEGETANAGFRDCAGIAVKRNGLRSFSAHGGKPATLQHEFAHAAFGIGDEYYESDSTRRVPPDLSGVGVLNNNGCCCVQGAGDDGTGGDGVGGNDSDTSGVDVGDVGGGGDRDATIQCTLAGGDVMINPPGVSTTTPCSQLPPSCGDSPVTDSLALCPPLRGDCVMLSAWLDGEPPDPQAARRHNVFPSADACATGRAAAAIHPGVENAATGLGACTQLCGTPDRLCPCGDDELWIVDHNPEDGAGDIMAGDAAPLDLHGGSCAWCVETALCVRWERSRGRTPQDAWDWCKAPPDWAP